MIKNKSQKIIGVMNYKGGTGKTTVAVNLAAAFAKSGESVLLIDSDAQGSASHWLGITPTETLYNAIIEGKSINSLIIPARNNLDIIGANHHLFPLEIALANHQQREHVVGQLLKSLTNHYDWIILDCAPTMSILNQNMLIAASAIFVPVGMEYLALIGVKQLHQNIQWINQLYDKAIGISYVIPTFFDTRKSKSKSVMSSLNRVFNERVLDPIHYSVQLSECPGFGQTIFEYAPRSQGASDFEILAKKVRQKWQ